MAKLTKSELARRIKEDTLEYLSEGDHSMDDLVAKHGSGLTLRFDTGYYDDPTTLLVVRIREESDEEYDARIKNLREIKAAEAARKSAALKAREDEERRTYERLRAKFERG